MATHKPLSIEEQVIMVIADFTDVSLSKIKRTTTLESLGLDSLAEVELIIEAEQVFKIELSDDDIDEFTTVGDVIIYIKQRVDNVRR